MKRCLKFFLLAVLPLLALLFTPSKVEAKTMSLKTQMICISDSTALYALSFDSRKDTLSLIGKGKKKGAYRYYKTSKANTIVAIRNENKSGVWLGFLSKIITIIFHAKV